MKTIAINRLHVLPMPAGGGISSKNMLVLQSELASMGYLISNPKKLKELGDTFVLNHASTMAELNRMRGGNVSYVPLFLGFPNNVPEENEYFTKRIIGYVGNFIGAFSEGTALGNGLVIPDFLFDLKEFGADPVTQFQDKELFDAAKKKVAGKKKDTHVEWIPLKLVSEDEVMPLLKDYLHNLLYAKSSIKEDLHKDVLELLGIFGSDGIDFDRVVHKEVRALLMSYFWNNGMLAEVSGLTSQPTDLLRMFASLTGTDVSLATKIKFPKMNRVQRKAVLSGLETCRNLAESLQPYRGLWLQLGRYLHPTEYKRQFPKTAQAFALLRADEVVTFNSVTENLILAGDINKLLEHLQARPGVFARKLHELLRKHLADTSTILSSLIEVANKITVKTLLVMLAYFETINTKETRAIVNRKGKFKVLPNNSLNALTSNQVDEVVGVLHDMIVTNLKGRNDWNGKTISIDPVLSKYVVPLQQRKTSDGLLNVGKGTRIPANFSKVLRLFVWWKENGERTDLDLSLVSFSENFEYLNHVSYTALRGDGIVHSGDIQSAPHGAAEFIDVTLNALPKATAYVCVQVHRFSGSKFSEIECHAGWMVRDKVDASRSSFDIKTVQNKFDVSGEGSFAIPLIVDIKAKEIIFTDLYVNNMSRFSTTDSAMESVEKISREIAQFSLTRPNLFTLAKLHVEASGGRLVAEDESPDMTIGLEGSDINLNNVEEVLSSWI